MDPTAVGGRAPQGSLEDLGRGENPLDVHVEPAIDGLADQVAADAFGATLLGKSLNDLPFIGMAEAAGLGTADYRSLDPESGIVD